MKAIKRLNKIKVPYKYFVIPFFIFFILSSSLFWVGFHNVDICHNEEIISLTFDLHIKEQKLDGEIWSLDDCYIIGLKQIIKGFFLSTFSIFMFGFALSKLIKEDSL